MTPNSLPPMSRAPQPIEVPAWMGEPISTGSRFSLADPALGSIDVVSQHSVDERFGRFLIAREEVVDNEIWQKLEEQAVPRLPLVRREDGTWIFGVKDGLKPLAHEALFGHPSSETYIGDPEIFYEVGRLYKRAFKATGNLLLQKDKPEDCPLEHIAISSFSDEQGFLFLYPPYKNEAAYYSDIDSVAAQQILADRIAGHLATQVQYHEPWREVAEQLVEKAQQGFLES